MKRIIHVLFITAMLVGYTAAAEPFAVRGVTVKAGSEEAALREAATSALKTAISELRLEATDSQVTQMLNAHPEYLSRMLIKLDKTEQTVSVTVDFQVDADKLRSALSKREVVRISKALGSPQIAFAIVPIAPRGTTLDAGSKRSFIEQINTSLKEEFDEVRFKVVSPDWLLGEVNAFTGDPARTGEFELNVRYRAKMDPNVHYLIVGTATIDTKAQGGETVVHLVIAGSILNTFTDNPLSVPFQFDGSIRGEGERVAIGQACQLVAERAARNKAVPRLITDWNEQVENGTEYIVHLLFDSAKFKKDALAALETSGEILDLSSLGSDLLRLRYRTTKIARKDFGDSSLLEQRLKGLPSEPGVFCVANQSEIFMGPDNDHYKKKAQAAINGQKYTLIDLQTLPQVLVEGKPSSQPVHEDADTALAMVAKRYAEIVGLVIFEVQDEKTGKWTGSGATAWAFGPKFFASNAHVTQPIERALAAKREAWIYLNRKQGKRLRITKAVTHPKYGTEPNGYDVGVLEVEENVETFFPIADDAALRAVDAGTRVAFLGFPMEGLLFDNVNLSSPIATMQSGIVTSVSDYHLADSGFSNNLLFRHNLPAVGGASGSPIFNANGAVVALLNAGNIIGQVVVTANGVGVERAPSAALINFGQRVDLLWDLVPKTKQSN